MSDTPTQGKPIEPDQASPTLPPVERIGQYRLLRTLGEGGFGIVYLAEQTEPVRRRVAVKVIKPGMDSQEVVARFEAERQALALMDHACVAKVLGAGTTERGLPYFVMEHCPGVPITEHCDRHMLSIEERLRLFIQVCEAVQHAHQKGVIHRDLKPSNILVAIQDARPIPKVIDFGVAKALNQPLTERTIFTRQGQLIGTPAYMSPEQAEMTAQDIDTRSDIYSLGVLLYELLTGALPFNPKSLRGAALNEIQRIIREIEPPKPSTRTSTLDQKGTASAARQRHTDPDTLSRNLRGDLDWIVMCCLEKDRTRRYETAHALALDLERHLNHEPVEASPPSTAYRLHKFVRRNRVLVAATSTVAAVLVLAVIGLSLLTGWALRERQRAEDEAGKARLAEVEQRQARAEAETSRAAEAEQRRLAETRAEEIAAARDQLQAVVDFQSSILSEVDAGAMGRGLLAGIREEVRLALVERRVNAARIDSALASFDESIRDVNATNVALKIMDEHILARAAEAIEKECSNQPIVRAALQQTVATTYHSIGLHSLALPLQKQALETRRRTLGNEHPDTLSSIFHMGYLLRSQGKFAEAEPYWREALDTRRRVLGNDHPETLTSISAVGLLLQAQGKLIEAERYHREALEGRRLVLGSEHPSTLTSIDNMGLLLKDEGRLAEAEPYCREALQGRRRVLGDEHARTLDSVHNMGALLYAQGKLAEAERCYREALDGSRRVLGDEHPYTLVSIDNMGFALLELGRLTEAEPYCREAVDKRRRVLGDEHPRTLNSINNMGLLLKKQGKLTEAEQYHREALEGRRRVLGDEHPGTLESIHNMGALLRAQGKLAEAEPYCREALEGRRRVLGNEHPHTLRSINNLATLLQDQGRLAEAEEHGAEAVALARRTLPVGHWHTGMYLGSYGKTLMMLERYVDAEALLLEGHEILSAALGAQHQQTLEVIRSLVALYTAWDAAEPGQGYDAQADAWRAKLPEQATGSRGDPAAAPATDPVTEVGTAATQPARASSGD